MANLKSLQRWKTICADARVSVSKSFFGMRTTAVYSSTQSVIDARIYEYTPDEGARLKRILDTPRFELAKAIGNFRPQTVPNGNYMLECCISRDGRFVALQLLQYQQMNYEPVTETLVYEGEEAHIISRLF